MLGEHRGMLRYTLGQRRGLGVSAAHRLFVVEKDLSRNAVILGDECDLYAQMCIRDSLTSLGRRREPIPRWLRSLIAA